MLFSTVQLDDRQFGLFAAQEICTLHNLTSSNYSTWLLVSLSLCLWNWASSLNSRNAHTIRYLYNCKGRANRTHTVFLLHLETKFQAKMDLVLIQSPNKFGNEVTRLNSNLDYLLISFKLIAQNSNAIKVKYWNCSKN